MVARSEKGYNELETRYIETIRLTAEFDEGAVEKRDPPLSTGSMIIFEN